MISQGGAPVPPATITRLERDFEGRVLPANGYGFKETSSAIIADWASNYLAKKDRGGLLMPAVDIRIVDEDGVDVPNGIVGELWRHGPNNLRGYWGKEKATEEAFGNGWFGTGDAARVDDEGYVYIVDRIKDMVLRGGGNVYCAEIEAAILEHEEVSDVAVIGLPHDHLGEEVAAVVSLKQGSRLEAVELQRFLEDRLAKFKIPSQVFFYPTELPRNATGKTLKHELRPSTRLQRIEPFVETAAG